MLISGNDHESFSTHAARCLFSYLYSVECQVNMTFSKYGNLVTIIDIAEVVFV